MEQFSTPNKTPIRKVLKEINVNKSTATVQASVKSPLAIDSDISSIETDTNEPSDLDSTIDVSYQNPNATLTDLLNGLDGLNINASKQLSVPHNQDGYNSLSSDDEMFQECESGSIIADSQAASVRAHSSNIDQHIFDKTINMSTIASHSTTGPMASITADLSLKNNVSDVFGKSHVADQTLAHESIAQTTVNFDSTSNITEHDLNENEMSPVELNNGNDTFAKDDSVSHSTAEPMASIADDLSVKNDVSNAFGKSNAADQTLAYESIAQSSANFNSSSNIIENDLNENEMSSVELSNQNDTFANDDFASLPTVDPMASIAADFPVKNDVSDGFGKSPVAGQTLANESITQRNANFNNLSNITENDLNENTMSPVQLNNQNDTFAQDDSASHSTDDPMVPITTELNENETSTVELNIQNDTFAKDDFASLPTVDPMASIAADFPVKNDVSDGFGKSPVAGQTLANESITQPSANSNSLSNITENDLIQNAMSPVQLNNRNDTFVKDDSVSAFNETHNLSKEMLSSTRSSMGKTAQNSTPLSKIKLNETIVVDNKLPSVNTSFIISPKPTDEMQPKQMDLTQTPKQNEAHDQFKLPAVPSTASNPFDLKYKPQNFQVSDDEFQSPGLILNSNDFDFLLSRGGSAGQINPRDSILERFDPILGRKSIVPTPLINRSEPTATVAQPSISTILEVDANNEQSPSVCANDSLNEIKQATINKSYATLNERNNNANGVSETIVKLDTSEKTELSNGGGGDNSQASSTTETYETASIGEPQKADVTMSVGLIHDLKMDNNMKSLEQDKVEPNLKMNDEHKVKQEMVSDVERKLKEAEAREEALLRRITEKDKALNKMSAVVENYEKTMVEMISEREQTTQNYDKQLLQLKSERDANHHHLTSLENTFSDLHIKYEKCKQMTVEVKEREANLVEKLEFCQQQMKLQEQRYDKLKNHALTQLEGANAKLEALNKAHTNEIKKLTAQLKKDEISRQSIMDQLAQKTKENEELVKICDELINNGADGS